MAVRAEGTPRAALWRDARFRGLILQIVVAAAIVALVVIIVHNTATNLARLGIASGFGFLSRPAGFDIGITLIPYSLVSSYGRVFLVGLLNTLLVAAIGIVLATVIGFTLGVLRLSRNWLVARLATVYVEVVRNVPLALQLLFWYFGVLQTLPPVRGSLRIGDAVFISIKGVNVPRPIAEPGFEAVAIALAVAILAIVALSRWARRRQERTGRTFPTGFAGLGLVVGLPLLAAAATGFPLSWDYPELKGFNYAGGMALQPEFVALLLGLVVYTASFIGEIVRGGIQAVGHGQTEAAYALGLRPGMTTRLVIIPQALRVIVPPLTSQYLNLTKNSTLATFIGYPDLVNVFAGTVLNQTGQAVEIIFITMLVYGTVSLGISALMNWYNRRKALVER